MDAILIINPYAGRWKARGARAELEQALTDNDI
jgi:hypothetical protein